MTAHDDFTCDAFAEHLPAYLEGDAPEAAREAMDAHAARCEPCGALLADLLLIPQQASALPALTPSRDLWSGIAERIDAPVLPFAAPRSARVLPSIRHGWNRKAVAAAALVLFTASVTHVATRYALSPATTTVASTTPAVAPAATRQLASATNGTASATSTPSTASATPDVASPGESPAAARRSTASSSARDRHEAPVPRTASERSATVRLASNDPLLRDAEPVYDREIAKLRRIVRERRTELDPHTIAVLEQSVAVIDSAIAQSRAALARDPASGLLANQLNHSLEKKVELLRTAALLPART